LDYDLKNEKDKEKVIDEIERALNDKYGLWGKVKKKDIEYDKEHKSFYVEFSSRQAVDKMMHMEVHGVNDSKVDTITLFPDTKDAKEVCSFVFCLPIYSLVSLLLFSFCFFSFFSSLRWDGNGVTRKDFRTHST
jgi:hypothetical protein